MVSLDEMNKIMKSKTTSSVLGYCILQPSCAKEIAMAHYGNITNFQDRNISKILNRLRDMGLVEEVDYNKYKISVYCKSKKAKHFYCTDEIIENFLKDISKEIIGTRKVPKASMNLIKNTLFRNRKMFFETFSRYPNVASLRISFKKNKVR